MCHTSSHKRTRGRPQMIWRDALKKNAGKNGCREKWKEKAEAYVRKMDI